MPLATGRDSRRGHERALESRSLVCSVDLAKDFVKYVPARLLLILIVSVSRIFVDLSARI